MAREGQLGTELSRVLRGQNAIVIPMVAGMHGMQGVCDKYFCHRYWRGWVELKAEGKVLEDHQRDFIRMVVERGDNAAAIQFTAKRWPCRMVVTVFKVWGSQVYQVSLWCNDAAELLPMLQAMQAMPREGYLQWAGVAWKPFI